MQEECEDYDREWFEKFGVEVIRDKSQVLVPSPRVIRALQKIIKMRNLHQVWFGAAAPLGLSARFLRKSGVTRIVALTHGHEVWWSKIPPLSFFMKEIGRHVDKFTYLGQFTKTEINRSVPTRKLSQIAPGIDTEHFKPLYSSELRRLYGFGDRPTILCVGRLVHRKGQDRLLEALPLIKASIPDAALVFIGEGGYRKRLEKLVKKYKLEDDIRFIGRIKYEELPAYFAIGDIFAMPTRSRMLGLEVEGLGIVYLEASSCALPVIAGRSGGEPDAVIDGKTGYIVDGRDVREITDRAVQLLGDPKLRKSMGDFGREWVKTEWSWKIWSQEFNSLMKFN
jgi:phosphatidylinositol alpha-1,6-mannosyltransferase